MFGQPHGERGRHAALDRAGLAGREERVVEENDRRWKPRTRPRGRPRRLTIPRGRPIRPKTRHAAGKGELLVHLGQGEPSVLGPARAGRRSLQEFAQGLLPDLLLGDAEGGPVVLQDHALPGEGRDVVPSPLVGEMVPLGVLDPEPEPALLLLELEPAPPRESQLRSFGIGTVRDDQSRELPAVGDGPLGVDAEPGDLGAEDSGLDPLREGEAREAELHGVEEVVRPRDDREHQDEGRARGGDGENADRTVEEQEVDAGRAEGGQLGVRREPPDPDEEPEEERDRQREDDDVRERERDDESGLGEGLLALDEELGELHEPAHRHEPRVREKPHEVGPPTSCEDVAVQAREHEQIVAEAPCRFQASMQCPIIFIMLNNMGDVALNR